MKTLADQFVETLAAVGVQICGTLAEKLYGLADALCRQGKAEWGHLRQEQAAASAAGPGDRGARRGGPAGRTGVHPGS